VAVIGDGIDAMLEEANGRLKELPGVEGHAVYGLVGEELASFGDEVDILIVGSRSYGPMRRLVHGSTANYLERHARCSLVVLPRGAVAGEHTAHEQDNAEASVTTAQSESDAAKRRERRIRRAQAAIPSSPQVVHR
jgi:universal stress protein family protein